MTIPPLSSSEDESARSQPGYDGERAASVGSEPSASKKVWLDFNVNHYVRIKLTDFGLSVMRENHAALFMGAPAHPFKAPTPNADGWVEMQARRVFQELGGAMRMGGAVPFETTIQIEAASPESLGVSQDEPESSDPSTAWRGIASAPRDGTEVLLLVDGVVHQADWQGPSDGAIYSRSKSTVNWFSHSVGSSLYDEHVTHWMPLPGAPS